MPTESRATKAVMRVLQRERPDSMWERIGEMFDMTSPEAYADHAKRWLGDKSNLGTTTIEEADYSVAWEHFKARQQDE